MRPGNLRHKVAIQQKTGSPDAMGSSANAWSTVSECFAAIWPISASERVSNQAVEHELTHRVRIRHDSAVTSDMRILHGSRVLNIKQIVNPCDRDITLDLLCMEKT